MKTLLATLLLATLCAATGHGQTMKALAYNTTNGQVVYSGTNTLTFTNAARWSATVDAVDLAADNLTVDGAIYFTGALTNIAVTRTNLSLGATWLTNTNVTNFRTEIGLGATNTVSFLYVNASELNTGNVVYGDSEISGYGRSIAIEEGVFNGNWEINGYLEWSTTTNAATTRTNLGLGSGITTNRTFVSYNGTNYTTNSVAISNGIITGWTQ